LLLNKKEYDKKGGEKFLGQGNEDSFRHIVGRRNSASVFSESGNNNDDLYGR
jgi:hypothetical protein